MERGKRREGFVRTEKADADTGDDGRDGLCPGVAGDAASGRQYGQGEGGDGEVRGLRMCLLLALCSCERDRSLYHFEVFCL